MMAPSSTHLDPPDGGGRGAELVAGYAWELSPQTHLVLMGRRGPYGHGEGHGLFFLGIVAYFPGRGRKTA